MFEKSRRKIILSIMGSLILLFVVTLSVIVLENRREIGHNNQMLLERYADLYALELNPVKEASQQPGRKPAVEEGPDFQLSTFYSVALDKDGSVLAVNTGDKNLYSEEELTGIAKDLVNGNRSSGNYGNLAFLIRDKGGYMLAAFIDTTVTETGMSILLRIILIVGGSAMVVLFFLSLILSKRIIRPLEENDSRQKRFISDASHELKTPVAVISANAELLSREVGENEWLANIQYENDRMGALVTQLLDLSRAENAGTVMERVDLSRIVEGEVLAQESIAFEKGKQIREQIAEGILLMGNPVQLTQLVSVLIDNAIRHSTGSEIDLHLNRQGHNAVLTVENDGEEIPPEKQAHLFDRFYRLDEARSSEEGHYGLGLSIAKAVADNHGGTIQVSCQDQRIRFTVVLQSCFNLSSIQ